MNEEIKLNSHGVNAAIKAYILPEDKMREIGFTDHCNDRWYFCRCLKIQVNHKKSKKKYNEDISFNLTIPKDGSDIRIDVLDENFCQPYDYQYMLEKNPTFKFALDVKEQVEKWMEYLQNNGVLSGHNKGDYI